MQQEQFSFEAAIIAVMIILLVLGAFIAMVLLVARKRKSSHIIEMISTRSVLHEELLKAQIEVQEQTLSHISSEIHDNISQVLSFVKLNMAMITSADEKHKNERIIENRELVSQVLSDLRELSRRLTFESITRLGLEKTIETEIKKINKDGLINAALLVEGKRYPLGRQRELMLFRIFQEGLNNTIKHAGAGHLKITLQYVPEMFTLTLEDDGCGFLIEALDKIEGSGLKNIKNRAVLIGAVAIINSAPGKGCYIKVSLNLLKERLYADGNHTDRVG